MVDFKGRCLRYFRSDLFAQFLEIICKDDRLVAGAGDGNVAKAGTKQVQMHVCVGMNQDTLGGKAPGAVTQVTVYRRRISMSSSNLLIR